MTVAGQRRKGHSLANKSGTPHRDAEGSAKTGSSKLKHHAPIASIVLLTGALSLPAAWSAPAGDPVARQLAHDIFKQLVEINTTDSVGNVSTAAQAMAQRLLDTGFSAADISVLGPNDRKRNMVARYRGNPKSRLKPILIIGHLDVVEARGGEWRME
jgi:hypothetical protein